jgi:hypothetical protein
MAKPVGAKTMMTEDLHPTAVFSVIPKKAKTRIYKMSNQIIRPQEARLQVVRPRTGGPRTNRPHTKARRHWDI